jgi:hypothetical protein
MLMRDLQASLVFACLSGKKKIDGVHDEIAA